MARAQACVDAVEARSSAIGSTYLPPSFLSLTISPRGWTNIPFHTPKPIRKAIGSSYGGEAELCSGEPFDINRTGATV